MTAPVSMEQAQGRWRVHFVMPSEYDMDTLPQPNNQAVTLREVPATRYAALRFSGFAGEQKVAKKTAESMAWIQERGIKAVGNSELARYNPPWALPFLRRNWPACCPSRSWTGANESGEMR